MHLDRLDVAVISLILILGLSTYYVFFTQSQTITIENKSSTIPVTPLQLTPCDATSPNENVHCFAEKVDAQGIQVCLDSLAPAACQGLYAYRANDSSICNTISNNDSCLHSFYAARLNQDFESLNPDAALLDCRRVQNAEWQWRCLELHARILKDQRFCQVMTRMDLRLACLDQLEAIS